MTKQKEKFLHHLRDTIKAGELSEMHCISSDSRNMKENKGSRLQIPTSVGGILTRDI